MKGINEMKTKTKILGIVLVMVVLFMSGCSVNNISNSTNAMQETENNSQTSKNQLKITDYFMLLQMPYDPVVEGCLSKEEKQELLDNRILKPKSYLEVTIKINKLSDKEIEIQGEGLGDNYSSRIKLFPHKNRNALIGREISFAQQNLIELFSLDSQKKN